MDDDRDNGDKKRQKTMTEEDQRLYDEQTAREQAARRLMEQHLQQERDARAANMAASQVTIAQPQSLSTSARSSDLNTGRMDVQEAANRAQSESQRFAKIARQTVEIANNNDINLEFLQSSARMDRQAYLASLRGPLLDWANEILFLANNPRLLEQYRPETIEAVIRQGQVILPNALATQQSRDRFNNLLGYIQTRAGEVGNNFVSALRTVLGVTVELIPTATAAAGMGLTFRAASWINAPLGTSLVPANMGFTQRIFNATAGTAQRLGSTMTGNPLLAPSLMVGFTLALIYSLPVRYQQRLNRYTRNFLIAVRSGSIEAINATMSLLLYAIDKLYQASSIGFLSLCRGAIGFGRGIVSGARNVLSVVASSASALGRAARCINLSELISITSAWMTGQFMALRTSGIDMFAYLTSLVVTEVNGAYQLNDVLSRGIMTNADISDEELTRRIEYLTIEDIDRQFLEEADGIQGEIDDGNTLFDGALAAAASNSNNHDEITEAIRSTITSAASSRASSRQSSAASSQNVRESSPPRSGVSMPALSMALLAAPVRLTVRETPPSSPSGETVATIIVSVPDSAPTTINNEIDNSTTSSASATNIADTNRNIGDIDEGGGRRKTKQRKTKQRKTNQRKTKVRRHLRSRMMRRRTKKVVKRRQTRKVVIRRTPINIRKMTKQQQIQMQQNIAQQQTQRQEFAQKQRSQLISTRGFY